MPQSSVCVCVCPSVTFRERDHTGWNTSKIIPRLISSRFMLALTPTWAIWCNGNTPQLEWNRGGVMSSKTCSAVSLKRCEIEPRLLWRNNRKSHTRFWFVPKSMTPVDLELPKRTLSEKIVLRSPLEKFEWRWNSTMSGKMEVNEFLVSRNTRQHSNRKEDRAMRPIYGCT